MLVVTFHKYFIANNKTNIFMNIDKCIITLELYIIVCNNLIITIAFCYNNERNIKSGLKVCSIIISYKR